MAATPKSAQINSGPGFRIRTEIERPNRKIIERIREYPTPDISDMLNRLYALNSKIHNLINDDHVVGPACTVKVYPGDNLMVHKALDIVEPGDIIVVDAGGSAMNGIIGDLISTKAKHRGVAAFIVDGLIRDFHEVKQVGLPVFARGVTPIGPLHRGPGEINYPIACGGIVVNPGDIIVGDSNGLVVVRQDFAEQLLERLDAQKAAVAGYEENVRKGIFSNEWVDNVLRDANCSINRV